MTSVTNTDVLVVGAGPIGLSTAIFLRSQNFKNFKIIDKASEPDEALIKGVSRAIGIHARTLELWEDVGVTPRLFERGKVARTASNYYRSKLTYRVEYPAGCDHSHVRYNNNYAVTQGNTIDVLHQHLTKTLAHPVQWKTELREVVQDENGVTATVYNHATSDLEIVKAKYIVGCDGCHSVLRKQLDIGFAGKAYPIKWVVCDLDIEWDIPNDDITFLGIKNKYVIALPLAGKNDNRFRVTMGMPLTPEELKEKSSHAAPMKSKTFTSEDCINFMKSVYPSASITATPEKPQKWFQVHCRMADKFRSDRCFLVGDAAHIHSPILGQGMNMGVQDANNLAWKLAAVCRGDSEESILNSYVLEREYSDKEIVKFVDRVTRLVITPSVFIQYLRGFVLSRILKIRSGRRKLITKVMQLSVNYSGANSPLIKERWRNKGKGITPGYRVPDPEFNHTGEKGKRLFQNIKGSEWNALIFLGKNPRKKDIEKAQEVAERISRDYAGLVTPSFVVSSVNHLTSACHVHQLNDRAHILHDVFGVERSSIYLIRPDRYVGYRDDVVSSCFNYLESVYPTHLAIGDIAYGNPIQ